MIIPGHIGGRMVKWLEEIEVAAAESDNHYHFMDNRVLPSHVDEALAKEEGELLTPPDPGRPASRVCNAADSN